MHRQHDAQRQDLTYRWASTADILGFYGALPIVTIRAVSLVLNGNVVGVIGLARGAECEKLFSDTHPELASYAHRFAILRAIKLVMSMVETSVLDVYAVRQDGTDILPRLGFDHVEGDIYKWHNLQ